MRVTSLLKPATIAAAPSTHWLPQVQSGGGNGRGGPAGGKSDLSGYLSEWPLRLSRWLRGRLPSVVLIRRKDAEGTYADWL